MAKTCVLLSAILVSLTVLTPLAGSIACAAPSGAGVILPRGPGAAEDVTPTSGQVVAVDSTDPAARGITVTIAPGQEDYPGVMIKPKSAPWDLSSFGHIEAHVVNTGPQPLTLSLRVDNAGDWHDNPWDTESLTLQPGQSGTVTTIFGYAYGHKPGYALKPSAIVNVMLFMGKSDKTQSFRIESLSAGGPPRETPPVAPEDARLKPLGGLLLGTGVSADAAPHITSQNAEASSGNIGSPDGMRLVFPAVTAESAGRQSVWISPPVGRWDLRDYLEVRVHVRNDGQTPVTPRVRLESNGGPSEWQVGSPLTPGSAEDVIVPFTGTAPIDLSEKDAIRHVTSDAVSAVTIAPQDASDERVLRIESIQAALPPQITMPAWLGKRPPVPGTWVKTVDDEFSGTALAPSLWDIYGDNYWDKQTHWSKADVLVGGGLVRLRYEKKTGHNNDDPAQPQTAYAAGYLHTYGKWTQRYGYFEARMKLPTAPGLWPAFWMMPDRGVMTDPQWKRQDTGNGGMEFDIMEHLDRWGPYRYNIAMHYDGYGKDHKSVGSDRIYVQPDKDGFVTCGLLWTPGSAVYYCNGREVLRWRSPRISDVPSILMFTLPMGGWDNNPLDDTRLPDDFVIDYVRVWQRRDLAPGLASRVVPVP